jgi:hypothetical protein
MTNACSRGIFLISHTAHMEIVRHKEALPNSTDFTRITWTLASNTNLIEWRLFFILGATLLQYCVQTLVSAARKKTQETWAEKRLLLRVH